MWTLESSIRLMVIGQEILIAAVFLFGAGARAVRVSGALFMLSVVGYLITSDPGLRDAVPLALPFTSLLALCVPYFVWLFARAIFEAPWPKKVLVYAAVAVGLAVWFVYLGDETLDAKPTIIAGTIMRVLALAIVAHALWMAVRGRPDDLIERRRTFRLFFVGIIALQVIAVQIAELVLAGGSPPGWLDLTNVIVIAIMTIGLAVPLLRLDADFFAVDTPQRLTDNEAQADSLGPAERVYCDKLLALMNSGYYRETGLTISRLAEKLNYPEHQLRRLINGYLGYRNFSAFLNSYRISAAQEELADPELARTPVLTIALDLGYASLGPFNRAFKEATETTPTQYRREKLGRANVDSE